jgi:hypothetical protein
MWYNDEKYFLLLVENWATFGVLKAYAEGTLSVVLYLWPNTLNIGLARPISTE